MVMQSMNHFAKVFFRFSFGFGLIPPPPTTPADDPNMGIGVGVGEGVRRCCFSRSMSTLGLCFFSPVGEEKDEEGEEDDPYMGKLRSRNCCQM